jgi:hypothetical protein
MRTVNTDDKGICTFTVECGKTYNVRAKKKGNYYHGKRKTNFDIALEKVRQIVYCRR